MTIWQGSRPHCISMSNNAQRTIPKETWHCVRSVTLEHMQETAVRLHKERSNEHVTKSAKTSHQHKVTTRWWNHHLHTDRTTTNNKPDCINRDNEKGTNRRSDFRSLQRDQGSSREDCKIQRPYNRNTAHVECNNKSDISNNKGQLEPSQNRSANNQESTTEQQPHWALHTFCGKCWCAVQNM